MLCFEAEMVPEDANLTLLAVERSICLARKNKNAERVPHPPGD